MSGDLDFFLAAPVFGAVAFYMYKLRQAGTSRLDASFAVAAERLGVTFVPRGKGLLFPTPSRVEGQVDHANVRVDSYAVSTNKTTTMYTRVLARAAGAPQSFTLKLTEQSLATKVSGLFGAQDVLIGDAKFDDMFVVKTSAPHLAPTLLRGPLARAIIDVVGKGEEVEIRVEEGAVELLSLGPVEEPSLLVAMVHCAAAIARAPKIALDRWSELAQALDGAMDPLDIWTSKAALPAIALDVHGVKVGVHAGDEPGTARLRPAETAPGTFDVAIVRDAGFALGEDGSIVVDATRTDIARAMEAIVLATTKPMTGAYRT